MKKIVVSNPFQKQVLSQAQKMIQENFQVEFFKDELGKVYDNLCIFIHHKPAYCLFSFELINQEKPEEIIKVYVGNQ